MQMPFGILGEANHSALSANHSLEEHLTVGLDVYLEIKPEGSGSLRCKSLVLGWDPGNFIMLEKPEGRGVPIIRKGQQWAVRFIHEGEIWGFFTVIENLLPFRHEQIVQVLWPKEVARVKIRRHERATVSVACCIQPAQGGVVEGSLTDISASGCRIRTNITAVPGDTLHLSFNLPGGVLVNHLEAIVRGRQLGAAGITYLGCEFSNLLESEHYGIGMFVTRWLVQQREMRSKRPRILLLSDTASEMGVAQSALGDDEYEIVPVSGMVELGYHLRISMPKALLISSDQKDISAIDTCRIVKSTPGFEELPIIIYNDCGGTLREKAQAAGAALCLKSLSMAAGLLPLLHGEPAPVG